MRTRGQQGIVLYIIQYYMKLLTSVRKLPITKKENKKITPIGCQVKASQINNLLGIFFFLLEFRYKLVGCCWNNNISFPSLLCIDERNSSGKYLYINNQGLNAY